jgi:outer membrane receptor for ferric coprogen and ferric-rhodotorulic acid
MKRNHLFTAVQRALFSSTLLIPGITLADTSTAEKNPAGLEEMLIIAVRENRVSQGATGLTLDIKETPQSISVVTKEQMEQFGAHSINDALRLTTGIQVDEWETNRTTYTARGFDIKNTQIDGVGLPNNWGIVTGAMESFGYEKIEVIRGANGLLTGVGNAAGTINFVRKRPTNEQQGSVGISYGSWNTQRVEADFSTPITNDGTWAGRLVVAHEEGDSYLRGKDDKRDFFYGVIDGQIGENGTLAIGYSHQQADTNGNMWGALAFMYSDGSQANWRRSASTSQDWTFWDTTTQMGFVDYTHQLASDWQVKASYNYRRVDNDDRLFYALDFTGSGSGIDPATGLGLFGYPYGGKDKMEAHLGEVAVDGHYELFGRKHDAMLGVSYGTSKTTNKDANANYDYDPAFFGYIPMPAFPWAGNVVPEPVWGQSFVYSTLDERVKRAFGATRFAVTDRFKTVVGFNYTEYHRDGQNYGVIFDQTEDDISPYAGLTYDFTDNLLGYVSYSDIYQPQDQSDAAGRYLAPTKGVNYEAGIKADWFNKRLLTTAAIFKAEQEGLATITGLKNDKGQDYYGGVDVDSKGVELEVTGKLTEHVDLVLGYTALKMDGDDGSRTYRWVPRRTANLLLSARLPSYTALSYGIGGRWQSDVSNVVGNFIVRQDSYTVLNGFVAWDVVPNATLRVNVDNLTNEKYINTLRYSGFYGAPRNTTVSVNYKF